MVDLLARASLGLTFVAAAAMPPAPAQGQEPAPPAEQEPIRQVEHGPIRLAEHEPIYLWGQETAVGVVTLESAGAEAAQIPQDIRIMQRIVSTALAEVEPPELPEVLQAESSDPDRTRAVNFGGSGAMVWAAPSGGNRVFSIGGRDATGFYMQGYGYLFTVEWRVGPRGRSFLSSEMAEERRLELMMLADAANRAAQRAEEAEARAAGEAERTLEQERAELEAQQAAWDTWSDEYRERLAGALREVVAVYGTTLKRAAPEESITFIADFGGGEAETVTVTARSGELAGMNREQNLEAVQVARGAPELSDRLRTELTIMAEIIDSSLQPEHGSEVWGVSSGELVRYFGGDSSFQRVPGYGVLFHKSARLNLASRVVRQASPSRRNAVGIVTPSFREAIDESTEEQREAYAEHLADLKRRTAEILATYGATLTGLGGEEWVGVYYNVGSAAGLLEGGISNFLVQARMQDIRDAASQADGAGWLLERLVTNERQD